MRPDLSEEDRKLVTLARAALVRIGARRSAAVRDDTGRSYTGVEISLNTLKISAVQLAVAGALASGAERLEVVVALQSEPVLDDRDAAIAREAGGVNVEILILDTVGRPHP